MRRTRAFLRQQVLLHPARCSFEMPIRTKTVNVNCFHVVLLGTRWRQRQDRHVALSDVAARTSPIEGGAPERQDRRRQHRGTLETCNLARVCALRFPTQFSVSRLGVVFSSCMALCHRNRPSVFLLVLRFCVYFSLMWSLFCQSRSSSGSSTSAKRIFTNFERNTKGEKGVVLSAAS